MERVAVIGAGAAGCFFAAELALRRPQTQITVFEAGPKALAKLAVTGGGRCNLTNSFRDIARLEQAYPRGTQLVKRAFKTFGPEATFEWWERNGVALTVQDDQCVFPVSQDAMQIVHTLERLMRERGVRLRCGSRISGLKPSANGWSVNGETFDAVVVTAGGSTKKSLMELLPEDISIEDPVPSLFTLKIPDEGLRRLMGTVVENAALSLAGTKFCSRGTLLLTDWGVSGPATLKLSSYAARHLAEHQYRATLVINWTGGSEESVRQWIARQTAGSGQKKLASVHPEGITSRLWEHLLATAGINPDARWAELGQKSVNRLANTLTADNRPVEGRARFKEEFVTCGGVSTSAIDISSLESKLHPGLFFAGEVLDVDAITGGFNLQAAWSMGYVAAVSTGKFLSLRHEIETE